MSLSSDPLWLRFVSGPDIDELGLTPADVVAAAGDVVAAHGRGETVFEPRTHLVPDNGGRGHFNVLRGHVSSLGERGVSGVKVVGDFVPNYELGLPSELALLTLYDPWTGVPQAIVDATLITEVRTGAMTAVGARHLARPDAKVLGHVGARGTAHSNIVMLDAMFDLDEIRVTSRRPESREAFADRLREELDTPVVVTGSVAETFDGADIAVEATRLTEPTSLVTPDLVAPGSLLVPYGTVSALDPDLLDVVDKVVVDDWREAQAGEFGALRPHLRSGALTRETLHAEIGEVVTGKRPGRENDRGADPVLAPGPVDPRRRRRPADPRAGRAGRPRHHGPLPVTVASLPVATPEDLGPAELLACARGAAPRLAPDLVAALGRRRSEVLDALLGDHPVYGVTTGMGALTGVRLDAAGQGEQSRRLLVGRAVGGPPWLSREEARAVVAVRLRTFLSGDAGVSPELCAWLVTLLE